MWRIKIIYSIVGFALVLIGYTFLFRGLPLVIWNKTDSAPKGLYLWTSSTVSKSNWAILKGNSATAKWIAGHGYIGPDWPIIKRVAAIQGDKVCRKGLRISLNGVAIAQARETDFYGAPLPSWSGCVRLDETQVFLINDHPHSLDGRYFGTESIHDLSGSARLIWAVS